MTTGKTKALTRWTFVGKIMSLLFNMLSRLVITFFPRSKRFMANSWGSSGNSDRLYFLGLQNHCSHFFLVRKAMTNLDSIVQSGDITLLTKVHLVKAMVFPGVMYGCDIWTIKNAEHWRSDAFELWCWRRLLRVPLDCKEVQPVHPEENQSWVFIGRTEAETEAPVLWRCTFTDVKNWLTGKDPDARKDWRQEEEGMTEDEMVRWHRWLNGHECEQAPGVGDGQRSLASCSP